MNAPAAPYRVGDRVRHAEFGEGLVLEVSPRGTDVMIRVSFGPPAGERRLMAGLAPLERMEGPPAPPPKRPKTTK